MRHFSRWGNSTPAAPIAVAVVMLAAAGAAVSQESAPSAPVMIEGVAATPSAAPVAALREIGERLLGLNFTVYDGKYVALGEGAAPPPLDTQKKKLLELKELTTGLFKAQLEIAAPADLIEAQIRMREFMLKGEADLKGGAGLLDARRRARQDALEKAILALVAERYPSTSLPAYLEGRVFFLQTLQESVVEGRYRLLARIKVELKEP